MLNDILLELATWMLKVSIKPSYELFSFLFGVASPDVLSWKNVSGHGFKN